VFIRSDIGHIFGFSKRGTQTFSLTDSKKGIPVVLTYNVATDIEKCSTGHSFLQSFNSVFKKIPVIIIRNKTDFVGITLFGQISIPPIMGHLPDRRLLELGQWKFCTRHAFLAQTPEDIRLILVPISGSGYKMPPPLLIQPGVMASSDKFAIHRICASQQGVPFDVRITQYTRIGCPP